MSTYRAFVPSEDESKLSDGWIILWQIHTTAQATWWELHRLPAVLLVFLKMRHTMRKLSKERPATVIKLKLCRGNFADAKVIVKRWAAGEE